ncbi:reverse transcriptase domain-containing protein [Tanacetum coccineum]|uniref:Reverse transcriptase domain-containing protein n=1 Tax=Tanacetum coccineum TaxID=301880 RepID=A0ABQ5A800_9ASTR
MLTTRQSMSSEASGKLIAQMVIDALLTYETNRNTRNGNGNGNGSHSDGGSGSRRTVHIARGCTYKEFLNCQPLNFNGTEGVVKYATCTLLNGSLTWWNSHVKTAGIDAAYDMPWKDLMKMMTEELALLCPKMVSDEEEKIERGKYYEKNYSSVRRYVADPDNAYPKRSITKLILKGVVIFDVVSYQFRCALNYSKPDFRSLASATNQKGSMANQKTITCFECGRQGHYRSEFPKLKNHNHGNAAGNGEARGKVYSLGG